MDSSATAKAPITALLRAWGGGSAQALEHLTPLIYDELLRRARQYFAREQLGRNTLQATALVNEAFLQLVEVKGLRWQDRAHFFAICAQMMRRILIDAARSRQAEKRGGQAIRITLDDGVEALHQDQDLVRLEDALAALTQVDRRKMEVIELRFFRGPDRGGNSRSAEGVRADRFTGLEIGEGLAQSRNEKGNLTVTVVQGGVPLFHCSLPSTLPVYRLPATRIHAASLPVAPLAEFRHSRYACSSK